MPSLYDNVKAANSSYVPQFVGDNFETKKSILDVLDTRYRQNRNNLMQAEIQAAQEQYLPQHKHIQTGLIENINKGLGDIASSKENFENSSNAVSNLVKDYVANPHRVAAQKVYQKAEKARVEKERLQAMGHHVWDFNPIEGYKGFDEKGNVLDWNADFTPAPDTDKKMQEMIGRIADDGYFIDPSGKTVNFDNTERSYLRSGNVNLIAPEKVHRLVEGLIPAYKKSDVGQLDLRRLQELEGLSPEEKFKIKEGNRSRETNSLDEDIRQRFRSLAAPQIFSKTDYRVHDFGLSQKELSRRAALDADRYSTTGVSSPFANTSLSKDTEAIQGDGMTQEINGRYYRYETPEGKPLSIAEAHSLMSNNYSSPKSKPIQIPIASPEEVTEKLRVLYNRDKAIHGNNPVLFPYKNFNEWLQSKQEADKNFKNVSLSPIHLQGETKKKIEDKINGQIISTPLYTANGEQLNLTQLAQKAGVHPTEISLEPSMVFTESPNQNIPGGFAQTKIHYKAGSEPNDKAPLEIYTPVSNEQVLAAAPIDKLFKNSIYKGEDIYTQDHPYDIEREFGLPHRDEEGNRIVYATHTVHKPIGTYTPGKQLPYETIVLEGKVHPNGSGREDITFGYRPPISLRVWKQEMQSIMAQTYKGAIDAGINTFNSIDIKEADLTEKK